jgi:gag-polypeptide of LTR copia-type
MSPITRNQTKEFNKIVSNGISSNTHNQLPTLNTTNWHTWRIQHRSNLMREGIWGIIENDDLTLKVAEASNGDQMKYDQLISKCKGLILQHLDPATQDEMVISKKTPREIWDTLAQRHGKYSATRKTELRRTITSYTWRSNSTQREEYKFTSMVNEYKSLGAKITDEEMIEYFLTAPAIELEQHAFHIIGNLKDYPTWSDAIAYLTAMERRQREAASRRRNGSNHSNRQDTTKFAKPAGLEGVAYACTYCKRDNHQEDQCYKKQRDQNTHSNNRSDNNNSTTDKHRNGDNRVETLYAEIINTETEQDPLIECSNVELPNPIHKWIMDSGCTHHVCNNRSLFTKYQELKDESYMVVAQGSIADIKGIGSVSIKTKFATLNITNVYYVPTLQKNLFSIPAATAKGVTVTINGNIMEIKNQHGATIATAKLKGNLYELEQLTTEEAQLEKHH